MKKLFLFSYLIIGTYLCSQNSIHLVSTNPAGTSTISVINNGGGFTVTTTPSSSDVPSKFRFYNTSSSATFTYNVLRTIRNINNQGVNTATTYFCVGATCLPPNANTLTNPGDYIVLSPGSYDAFIAYFSELSTIGYSEVYYKIFNINNPNDTLGFTMYYNPSLNSVKESQNVLENITIFPIPAKDNINIHAKFNSPLPISISIYNILGQKIIHQHYNYSELYLKKNMDVSFLPSGIYFLKIDNLISGQNIFTKKIIIE
ncbi:MAG: T9SS type A sorting domain-containing protein [Bacteroidia bacterium]|nr:T9SS type A sorting domain-containing protein [Bacteroidia bacterium]